MIVVGVFSFGMWLKLIGVCEVVVSGFGLVVRVVSNCMFVLGVVLGRVSSVCIGVLENMCFVVVRIVVGVSCFFMLVNILWVILGLVMVL